MTSCVGHQLLMIVAFHHPDCFPSIMSLGGAAWTFGHVGRAPMDQLAHGVSQVFTEAPVSEQQLLVPQEHKFTTEYLQRTFSKLRQSLWRVENFPNNLSIKQSSQEANRPENTTFPQI